MYHTPLLQPKGQNHRGAPKSILDKNSPNRIGLKILDDLPCKYGNVRFTIRYLKKICRIKNELKIQVYRMGKLINFDFDLFTKVTHFFCSNTYRTYQKKISLNIEKQQLFHNINMDLRSQSKLQKLRNYVYFVKREQSL